MLIAVVIPVYNERRWVRRCVERLLATPVPREGEGLPGDPECRRSVILVDDASDDGSGDVVRELGELPGIVALRHEVNLGKGAALRTGFSKAIELGAGVVIVHDADLEYDPRDHEHVLRPILDGRADAVIGSRFIGHTHRVLYFWHSVANRLITLLSNVATNLNLTDIECCTKALRADVLRTITIREDRFGIEPELVAKVARARVATGDQPEGTHPARVYEVAVSYAGRTYSEGKKITWRDGLSAVRVILSELFNA